MLKTRFWPFKRKFEFNSAQLVQNLKVWHFPLHFFLIVFSLPFFLFSPLCFSKMSLFSYCIVDVIQELKNRISENEAKEKEKQEQKDEPEVVCIR